MKITSAHLVVLFLLYASHCINQVECQFPVCPKNGITLNISEAVPVGSVVYEFNCTQPDGNNLTYELNDNGNTFDKFAVNNRGQLYLNKFLNADFTFKYNLHIKVIDSGPSQLSTKILVGIIVHNINDNTPVIRNLPEAINIEENTPIGTKIGTCTVNDKDFKQGVLAGKTRVGIVKPFSPPARRWVIDSETCDLYVNTLLDYENKKNYKIGIVAFDLDPFAPRTATASVAINVIDVNDNYPRCKEHYKIIGIPEDRPIGSVITVIDCTDLDSNENGKVYYRIGDTNNQAIKDSFTISAGGEIKIRQKLDYETLSFYDIDIYAYDGGDPSLTTTVIVGVYLTDVDDNIPTWPVDPISRTVEETTPLGTVVFALSANDKDKIDTAASTVRYGIKTRPNPDWFEINTDTGAVYVTGIMNYIDARFVTMEVFAYSSDRVNFYHTVTVNITLIDENNVAPVFDQVFYQGNISEAAPVGTRIFTVRATDPEFGVNGQVRYSIVSDYFQVHPTNGDVTLKKQVDFETDTVFSLNIEAHDGGTPVQRGYTFILINVIPVNEFQPKISQPSSPITIPEDAEPGTLLFTFTVEDGDAGFDGAITYSLANPYLPFTIEPMTGLFRIGSQLDRETIPDYTIVVIARDNSESDPKSSSATVSVILEDVNDHNPRCQPLSNAVIKLPHQIGAVLDTIKCTDADIGTNADFTYLKISGDDRNAFEVDESTGEIRLAKNPTETEYTLTIMVEDKGDPKLNVIVAYNIIAELIFNFTNLPNSVNFTENTQLAYELYDIEACCAFSLTRFELLSGNDENHVIIDPSSGKLILMHSFDREKNTNFRYIIQATSLDTNSVARSYLDVTIDDANDNTPKFDTSFRYISVYENVAPSTSLVMLTATDLDAGKNKEITYSIQGGNVDNAFGINQNGILNLEANLDAETFNQYSLVITATDGGDVPLVGTSTIFIDVLDVNEFKPVFVNVQDGVIRTNVSEGEALGALMFSLKAEDQDLNTKFTYSILQGNTEQAFVIDGSTGDIYLAKILDRETTAQYNLTVEVETQNNERVTGTLMIDILDINDNDPKFAQDVYQLQVTHEDPIDTLLTTFIITDKDMGLNKEIISLNITDGDPKGHFKVVGNQLFTKTIVDYYDQKLYSLTLQANDGGNPRRSGLARVVVNVLPKFKPPKFLFAFVDEVVLEDLASGSLVYDLDATAEGGREGDFGTIRYRIRSGNNANDFYISDTTGEIRVASRLDFETTESYTMIIDARSREDPTLSSSTTLNLNIQNINDNVPFFNRSVYSFNIDEDGSPGDVVGTVTATDLDKPPFNTITYSLQSTIGSEDWTIDNGGKIILNNNLDYRRQNIYNIPVIANDGGVTQGESLVVIRINDVNDNAPTFTPDNVTIDVIESMSAGQTFYTVKAVDLDSGINGQIKYTLVSGNTNNRLTINQNTGALSVATSLDRETLDRFDLVIRAEDKATIDVKSGTLYLRVNVADVNDHDPEFAVSVVDATISRSAPAGVSVITVTAVDSDIGENAEIEYEISDGNSDGLFLIGVNTGKITTSSEVGTAENEYNLRITAKDRGYPSRSSSMTVRVQIRPFKVTGPSEQSMTILEERPINSPLSAVTPKAGHNAGARIKYAIAGGNIKNSFRIDENTGVISTARVLDREEYPSYILTIAISDDNNVSYTKTISINVLDINDNDPVITTTDTNIYVVENTPSGQIVAGFTVVDPDGGVGGETDLSISSTPVSAGIYFNTRGKFLVINKPIDYETTQTISFSVLAVDRGDPKRTGTVDLTINVVDVSDNEIIVDGPGESPSVYITTEISSSTRNGETVIELTSKDVGLDTATGVKFTTLNREGIFIVDESGVVRVNKTDLLEPELKYFVWLVVTRETTTNKSSVLALLRIDTFDPNKHLVSLESTSEADLLEPYRNELLDSLGNFFLPIDVPKIWKIIPYGSTTYRRKLLASSTETLVYVMKGPVSYDIADIDEKRTFMEARDLLEILRMVPAQVKPHPDLPTPNYPVVAVNAFYIPDEPEAGETEQPIFESSLEGYITFAMLALLLLLILLIIIIFCCYKKKKRREKQRLNDSSESLVVNEPSDAQRRADFKKNSAPALATFEHASNKTSKRTSQNLGDITQDPSTSGHSALSDLDIHPIFQPLPPVQTEPKGGQTGMSLSPYLREEHSRRGQLQPIERKSTILPYVQEDRRPETLDPNGQASTSHDLNDVVPRRTNGPVVHRGKEYDGIGFDSESTETTSIPTDSLGSEPQSRTPPSMTVLNPNLIYEDSISISSGSQISNNSTAPLLKPTGEGKKTKLKPFFVKRKVAPHPMKPIDRQITDLRPGKLNKDINKAQPQPAVQRSKTSVNILTSKTGTDVDVNKDLEQARIRSKGVIAERKFKPIPNFAIPKYDKDVKRHPSWRDPISVDPFYSNWVSSVLRKPKDTFGKFPDLEEEAMVSNGSASVKDEAETGIENETSINNNPDIELSQSESDSDSSSDVDIESTIIELPPVQQTRNPLSISQYTAHVSSKMPPHLKRQSTILQPNKLPCIMDDNLPNTDMSETQQRYAYNTRTGSTLWEEKNNNLGKGKGGKNKKKATPMLTVVSEAKTDFSPNANMQRSIEVISHDK